MRRAARRATLSVACAAVLLPIASAAGAAPTVDVAPFHAVEVVPAGTAICAALAV